MKKNGYHKYVDKREVQRLKEKNIELQERLDFYYRNRTTDQMYAKNKEIDDIEKEIENNKIKIDEILVKYNKDELEI